MYSPDCTCSDCQLIRRLRGQEEKSPEVSYGQESPEVSEGDRRVADSLADLSEVLHNARLSMANVISATWDHDIVSYDQLRPLAKSLDSLASQIRAWADRVAY